MSSATDTAIDPESLATDAPELGDGEALHIHGETGPIYARRVGPDAWETLYSSCGLLETEDEFALATLADARGYDRVPVAETPLATDGQEDSNHV